MPWTAHNPELATRPPLNSHAVWNLRKRSDLPPSQNCMESSDKGSHCLLQYPVLPTQQLALACQSNGSIMPKPHGLAVHTPNPLPPAQANLPHQIAPNPKSTSFAWTVILPDVPIISKEQQYWVHRKAHHFTSNPALEPLTTTLGTCCEVLKIMFLLDNGYHSVIMGTPPGT